MLKVLEPSTPELPKRPAASGFVGTLESLAFRTTELLLARTARRLGHMHDRVRTAALMAAFRPRPDDIFIATYPRSGTTWLQMVLHQLLHGPDLEFEHINDVCPWFERGRIGSVSDREEMLVRFERLPSPRVFKTHLSYDRLRDYDVRYIYCLRNGLDVARSNFHFVSHGESDFSAFFRRHFMSGRLHGAQCSWFEHVSEWKENVRSRNVLLVRYEDMRANLVGIVERLAQFCGVRLSKQRLDEVLAHSTFEAMKANEGKFDYMAAVMLDNRRSISGEFLRNGGRCEEPVSLRPEDLRAYRRELERHHLDGG